MLRNGLAFGERTRAGMLAAQKKGRPLGRPPALTTGQRQEVFEAVKRRGEAIEDVARRYHVHTRTIRRVLKAASEDDVLPVPESRHSERKATTQRRPNSRGRGAG